jgi:hypothetical protein
MPRIALLPIAVVAALLVASQFVLPELAERRVENRLERGGGEATASLSAFPALRLLFDDGDSFEAEGRGLRVDVTRREQVLERLDGFGEVRVRLTEVVAGPLDVSTFDLRRAKGQPNYDVRISAETSPRDVAAFLGSSAGGPLGGVLGSLAAESLPGGGARPVPFDLDAQVESREGDVVVSAADGSVAGVPAGPLAELLIEAVALQL